ncbi:MAG TPA: CopD family protein [Dissulfurispiraceae bacterium]|nr:CopD family protein [Dissulfurispiraceae bacterium]
MTILLTFHSLMTFIDLSALSAVCGTILCLHWTICPVCAGEAPTTNPCFDRSRRLLLYCLLGLSISSIGILFQRTMEMAGVGIMEISPMLPVVLFKSHFGTMWLLRAGAILLAWSVWLLGRKRLDSKPVILVLLTVCAVIAFARSDSSHAADYGDLSLQQFADFFHLMAAICLGGPLISMSIILSASDISNSPEQQHIIAAMADRFYKLFGPVFAVIVATGLYNSWVEVNSFEALATTTYGWILSVKLIVFACLSWRYLVLPQRGRDEAAYAIPFARRARVDTYLFLAILLCVALLTHGIPARHAAHINMMMDHGPGSSQPSDMETDHGMSHHMQHGHGM